MSVIKYGIAAALGYHFGQPQGRKQLQQLRRQVVQLSKRPEVKQWRERGWDIAYERALAAKRLASTAVAGRKNAVDPAAGSATSVADPASPARLPGLRGRSRRAAGWRRSRPSTHPTPADPAVALSPEATGTAVTPTGFGGRTVAEDSEAAITGLVPPPPLGRTPPPSPAPRP